MNNVSKPALYGLTQPTIGKFFLGNHLSVENPIYDHLETRFL
jgi:hypothetical protein